MTNGVMLMSIFHPFGQKDMVNSPAHYTRGKQEAIEIIEEAITRCT